MRTILALLVLMGLLLPANVIQAAEPMAIGEVASLRSENGKTTYLGNDLYSLDVSLAPVHYKNDYSNASEAWKDIDLTIINNQITTAPYILTIDPANYQVTVFDKKTGSVVSMLLMSVGDKSLAKVTEIKSKGSYLFKDVAKDIDVKVTAENSQIRLSRVLKSATADTTAKYVISTSGTGIATYSQSKDAKGESLKVDTTLKDGILTESIDKSKYSNIVYPLTIDPSIDVQPSANSDDCSTYWNGAAWAALQLDVFANCGYYTAPLSKAGSGFRWSNVALPNAAVITVSYCNMTTKTDFSNDAVNGMIVGDKESDAATWTTIADYAARRGTDTGGANNNYRTTAEVQWNTIPDTAADVVNQTPSIVTVIQEIVNQAGWASGNHLALWIDDHDDRTTHTANNPIKQWYSYDGSAAKSAKLHVEYAAPPIVTTSTATNITGTGALTGGNITDISGLTPTQTGTQYDVDTGSPYANNITNTGVYGVGIWTDSLPSLTKGELYYYRAFAMSTAGYGYGSEKSLQTIPDAPTGPSASSVVGNSTAIVLAWTKATCGTGSTVNTVVRYKTGSYPTSLTDGTLSYNGTASSFTQGGLIVDTYYFKFWTQVFEGALNTYSTGTVECTGSPAVIYPEKPVNFTVNQISSSSANITWSMGLNAATTYIRGSDTGYPSDITKGYFVYSGNDTYVMETGINPSTGNYYYSAWSVDSSGLYSLDYATDSLSGGNAMLMFTLIFLALGITAIAYIKNVPALAIGGGLAWGGITVYCFGNRSGADIYYLIGWLGIAMALACFLEPVVMAVRTEEIEGVELDDTEQFIADYQAQSKSIGQLRSMRRRG